MSEQERDAQPMTEERLVEMEGPGGRFAVAVHGNRQHRVKVDMDGVPTRLLCGTEPQRLRFLLVEPSKYFQWCRRCDRQFRQFAWKPVGDMP